MTGSGRNIGRWTKMLRIGSCFEDDAIVRVEPNASCGDRFDYTRIENVLDIEDTFCERAGCIIWQHRNRPLRDDGAFVVPLVHEVDCGAR